MFKLRQYLILFSLGLISACQAQDKSDMNHLAEESSPYLLQHARNPVDWYPWKDNALEKAQAEDRLMVISVGYSACHWCHVMEHESFEDQEVAELMNAHYVNIKVDREERPDIDEVYMSACQVVTQWSGRGSCGWPLNVIALPDGRPIFAGTYFPKEQWMRILDYYRDAYINSRDDVEQAAEQITSAIRSTQQSGRQNPAEKPNADWSMLDVLLPKWDQHLDKELGGRIGAPKFPMPINYEYLLKYHALSEKEEVLNWTMTTLDQMAMGGIYDQIGGGFARYSVDSRWLVPHFEKMLYDNGQLVSLYSHAYQSTGKELYREIVYESLDFIAREMTSPEGAFYSALDADSDGEEGKYYVWTEAEIDELLGQDADAFKKINQVNKDGNWEHGKNILHRKKSDAEEAAELGMEPEAFRKWLKEQENILLEHRAKRIRPGLDDKALCAWNALMLNGYIDAYRIFGEDEWLQIALKNAQLIERKMMQKDGRLNRNYKDGKSVINAFLDDYALLSTAYINLYQATFDEHWLDLADKLASYVLQHFGQDDSPLLHYTSDLDPALIVRPAELSDNVIPSSNSSMARALLSLSHLLNKPDYLERAEAIYWSMDQSVRQYPVFHANWALLLSEISRAPFQVAIVGEEAEQLRKAFDRHYLPQVLMLGGEGKNNLELLENKGVKGETWIYVCQDRICKLPVQTVDEALEQIKNW